MFASLRSRLWLTYFILTAVTLGVIAISLFVYLLRNPLLYRQDIARLRVAESVVALRADALVGFQPERVQRVIEREDDLLKVRVLILDGSGKVIADSRAGKAPNLARIQAPLQTTPDDQNKAPATRDAKGTTWLYRLRALDPPAEGNYLVVAVPLPRIQLQTVLRDEFALLVVRTGSLALILSLLLGILMSQWISAPLRDIAAAARGEAGGAARTIPPRGPSEVQDLARAYNDMTRRVQLSQQSQRDFVANVSHELKTPLTSIQGFAQAILDGAVSSPEALQQAANVIYGEAGRMYRLVMDLLTLARLDAGTANLKHSPVDMGTLIQGVAEKMGPQARQAQIDLQVSLSPLPLVSGDEDRLAQVVTNLVDNAIKYTPPGGKVQLSARPDGGKVEVSVADTGPGVSREEQERIFERFYQADKSRRGGAGRGVGLGLAIAREIVSAHGGTIQLISSPGQGSHFMIRIPVARTDETAFASYGRH